MPFPLPSLPGCPLADWLMAGLPGWIPLEKLLGRQLGTIIFKEHLFLCSDKGQRLSAEPVCSGTRRSQPIPCHRSARSPSLSQCAQSPGTSWALAQGWARCSLPADTHPAPPALGQVQSPTTPVIHVQDHCSSLLCLLGTVLLPHNIQLSLPRAGLMRGHQTSPMQSHLRLEKKICVSLIQD